MTAAEDIATPELVRQLHTIPFTLRATVANGDTVPTVSMISAKIQHVVLVVLVLVLVLNWTGPVRSIWIRTGRSLIVDSKELRT